MKGKAEQLSARRNLIKYIVLNLFGEHKTLNLNIFDCFDANNSHCLKSEGKFYYKPKNYGMTTQCGYCLGCGEETSIIISYREFERDDVAYQLAILVCSGSFIYNPLI